MRETLLSPIVAMIVAVLLVPSTSFCEVAIVAASTKDSLFDQAGTVVAKVATNDGELRSTVRNYTSANVFVPAVAHGQMDFGVANQYEITLAVTGESYFAGQQQDNLRAIAVF